MKTSFQESAQTGTGIQLDGFGQIDQVEFAVKCEVNKRSGSGILQEYMQIHRVFIYFYMTLRNIDCCMIGNTIRVIDLDTQVDILHRNLQIRVFEITIQNIEIGMIGWNMFFIIFSPDESIKINL